MSHSSNLSQLNFCSGIKTSEVCAGALGTSLRSEWLLQPLCLEAAGTFDQNSADNVSVTDVCHLDLVVALPSPRHVGGLELKWPPHTALFKAVSMTPEP